jgi:hypothetical protein
LWYDFVEGTVDVGTKSNSGGEREGSCLLITIDQVVPILIPNVAAFTVLLLRLEFNETLA